MAAQREALALPLALFEVPTVGSRRSCAHYRKACSMVIAGTIKDVSETT